MHGSLISRVRSCARAESSSAGPNQGFVRGGFSRLGLCRPAEYPDEPYKKRRPAGTRPPRRGSMEKARAHDRYMTMREIRAIALEALPGAVVRRKLFWSYALLWTKETAQA